MVEDQDTFSSDPSEMILKNKGSFVDISKAKLQIMTCNKIEDDSGDESTVNDFTESPGILSCQSTDTEVHSHSNIFHKEIDCPAHLVGRVIGERGLLVKKLQSQTQCAVSVAPSGLEPSNRKITLRGCTQESVDRAFSYINQIIEQDGSRFTNVDDRKIISVVVKCPANSVGRIIGKNGANIKTLQSSHNVNIMINQSETKQGLPATVTIAGRQLEVKNAERIIVDYISGTAIPVSPTGGRTISCSISHVQLLLDSRTNALDRVRAKSNASIEVELCCNPPDSCLFHITGTKEEVNMAAYLILSYMPKYYPTLVPSSCATPIPNPYPNMLYIQSSPLIPGPSCQYPVQHIQFPASPPVPVPFIASCPQPMYVMPLPPRCIPPSMQYISHGHMMPSPAPAPHTQLYQGGCYIREQRIPPSPNRSPCSCCHPPSTPVSMPIASQLADLSTQMEAVNISGPSNDQCWCPPNE